MIQENIQTVRQKIAEACKRSGREQSEVTLICVSKTKPESDIEEAYAAGERHFGENKVQELTQKQNDLPEDIKWHMIGHLQRNKVKYLMSNHKTEFIHSIDSIRLAKQVEEDAVKYQTEANILIEVNVANEESKFGLETSDVEAMIREIAKECPHLHICGLMTIAPFVDNPEDNRIYFRELKNLSKHIDSCHIPGVSMKELSMGMTNDYEVAIEEGATIVRVGTGIFGNRIYSNIQ